MEDIPVMLFEHDAATEAVISGPLTVDRIDELRLLLQQAFARGKPVRLSLAAVTEIDIAGLQLICSAHRTAVMNGTDLVVIDSKGDVLAEAASEAWMLARAGCSEDRCGICIWEDRAPPAGGTR